MINLIFKKSIAISMLGHLTAFGLFGVSFGRRLPATTYDAVTFQGSVLNNFDFSLPLAKSIHQLKHTSVPDAMLISRLTPEEFSGRGYVKPAVFIAASLEKQLVLQKATPPLNTKVRAVVMLYPRLPHSFSIYFKDRQVVHIELMFKISSSPQSRSILTKRKISSGNLEADLLCMRYINHYLFLQQKMLSSDGWQDVKIELSAKND